MLDQAYHAPSLDTTPVEDEDGRRTAVATPTRYAMPNPTPPRQPPLPDPYVGGSITMASTTTTQWAEQ